MNLGVVRELFDFERQTLETSDSIREVSGSVVRHISRYSNESMIVCSDLEGCYIPAVIADQIAYFTSIGHDFEWKTYSHDQSPDLVSRLGEAGFSIGATETVLVALVDEVAAASADCPVEVRRLSHPDQIEDYLEISSRVWGGRPATGIVETMRSDPQSIGLYVAYWSGQPVGSCRGSFHSGSAFSGLWGGAVLPEYRGKGVYRSMVKRRALDAQSFGATYLQVDALPTSQPILEQLGFQKLSVTIPCVWRRVAG